MFVMIMLQHHLKTNNKLLWFDHPMLRGFNYDDSDLNKLPQIPEDTNKLIDTFYGLYFGEYETKPIGDFMKYNPVSDRINTADLFHPVFGDVSGLLQVASRMKTGGKFKPAAFNSVPKADGAKVKTALQNQLADPKRIIGVFLEHTPGENQVRMMLRHQMPS